MSTRSLVSFIVALYCISLTIGAETKNSKGCYKCRGINCLRTSKQNSTETCLNNEDVCVTIFDKFTVQANGCLLTMPVELRSKCIVKSNPECQLCVGDMCNNIGRKDFKCFECDDNKSCSKNVSTFTPAQCGIPSALNSYCFTEILSGGRVRRGCSLHVKDQQACLADSNCALCLAEDGPACNVWNGEFKSDASLKGVATIFVVLCAFIGRIVL